jgi:hypothetical protein
MASDGNGRKSDEQEEPPRSGPTARLSARAPSAWGATRDALSAVHNLEALLRSPNVLYRTILDLLPELRTSAGVLSSTFEGARGDDAAATEVGLHGAGRTTDLVRLLDDTALGNDERTDLADRACALADELEATADLLALLERAADPAPTEVDIHVVVREAARLSGSRWGRELVVWFDDGGVPCAVYADPYVVGPLLSLMVALVVSRGVEHVLVRSTCATDACLLTLEERTEGEALPSPLAMRVLAVVPPTAAAARRVAQQIGATLSLGDRGGSLLVPRSSAPETA